MNILVSGSTSPNSMQASMAFQAEPVQLSEGQLIEATVQRLTDSVVWLNVGGRMLMAHTEIPLQPQQQVLLEVTQADPAGITLRALKTLNVADWNVADGTWDIAHLNLDALLTSWGIEADEVNLLIAQALLERSHTISPEEIQTVRTLWQMIPPQSLEAAGLQEELDTLVYLHTNQLPIDGETLSLAHHWLNDSHPIAERLADLQLAMSDAHTQLLATGAETPALKRLLDVLETGLVQMANWSISADTPTEEVATRLARLVLNLGTPPEAELANQPDWAGQPSPNSLAKGGGEAVASPTVFVGRGLEPGILFKETSGQILPEIRRLETEADVASVNPLHRLASAVTEVLSEPNLDGAARQTLRHLANQLEWVSKDLGAIHLSNLTNTLNPTGQQPYYFPVPLATPEGLHTAQLKVYRQPGQNAVDPENLRLALLLDLPELGEIAINLTIFQRHLNGQILSERQQTHDRVEMELDKLYAGLSTLGYQVDALNCGLLPPKDEPAPPAETGQTDLLLPQVNIRI